MSAPRSPALASLALAAVGLLALTGAQAETVHVNVLEGENLGCTGDDADFEVHVYHDGGKVAESREITHDDTPVWGELLEIQADEGDRIGFRVSEGESSLFSQYRRDCHLGADGGRQANVTYEGETATHHLEGSGPNTSRVTVVVGPDPPEAPSLDVPEVSGTSARLAWTLEGSQEADEHRLREGWQGEEFAKAQGSSRSHTWTGLAEERNYTAQVLTDRGPWLIASNEVSFTTGNPPPPKPVNVQAWTRSGGTEIAFELSSEAEAHTLTVLGADTIDSSSFREITTVGLGPRPGPHSVYVEEQPGAIQLETADDGETARSDPVRVQEERASPTGPSGDDTRPEDGTQPDASEPPEDGDGLGGVPPWVIVAAAVVAGVLGVFVGYALKD